MGYAIFADVVVAVHVMFVAFVVGGELFVVVGLWRGWPAARHFGFRAAHLLAILIVAAESVAGITCPLTYWEDELRRLAGQAGTGGDFLGHYLHRLIFYPIPPRVALVGYVGFALLVAVTFMVGPPRRPALSRGGRNRYSRIGATEG